MTEFEKAQIRLECLKIAHRLHDAHEIAEGLTVEDVAENIYQFIVAPKTT